MHVAETVLALWVAATGTTVVAHCFTLPLLVHGSGRIADALRSALFAAAPSVLLIGTALVASLSKRVAAAVPFGGLLALSLAWSLIAGPFFVWASIRGWPVDRGLLRWQLVRATAIATWGLSVLSMVTLALYSV